jgi:hypothetical protein
MEDRRALQDQETRRSEFERFLAVYEAVKAELLRIPGVLNVGVGLRERGGALTREQAFRVYVGEKLPLSEVPAADRIPKEIEGFPIDVIQRRDKVVKFGFNDENDEKNYGMKVGGIRIRVDVKSALYGTLGCFATLDSDGSTVLLSNHHILMPREHFRGAGRGTDNGIGVGQPNHSSSLCCICNEMAKNVDGDKDLDCAIARVKPEVQRAPKVRRILRNDGKTELEGALKGWDRGSPGDEVWKVGAKSGLTRGTISEAILGLEIHAKAPFPYFVDDGDSGSVVVNAGNSKVVGLLHSGNGPGAVVIGFASFISSVLLRLGITIIETPGSQTFDVRGWQEERIGVSGPARSEDVFAAAADRLRMTPRGRELLALISLHQTEIGELINRRRAVMVAWRRSQGPAYLAALMRAIREPSYRLPQAIDGVTRQEFARRLHNVLLQHGSDALRAGLQANALSLMRLWLQCSTFGEAVEAWERTAARDAMPVSV